jgi:hypothetical protein
MFQIIVVVPLWYHCVRLSVVTAAAAVVAAPSSAGWCRYGWRCRRPGRSTQKNSFIGELAKLARKKNMNNGHYTNNNNWCLDDDCDDDELRCVWRGVVSLGTIVAAARQQRRPLLLMLLCLLVFRFVADAPSRVRLLIMMGPVPNSYIYIFVMVVVRRRRRRRRYLQRQEVWRFYSGDR